MLTQCVACQSKYLVYSRECPKCGTFNHNKQEPLGLIIVASVLAVAAILYFFL